MKRMSPPSNKDPPKEPKDVQILTDQEKILRENSTSKEGEYIYWKELVRKLGLKWGEC